MPPPNTAVIGPNVRLHNTGQMNSNQCYREEGTHARLAVNTPDNLQFLCKNKRTEGAYGDIFFCKNE